jgi:nucleotide-binding universal stress UspA family protein
MGADLIVMTSHGRTSFSRAWLGSVADAVVREGGVPVLVLRPVDNAKQISEGAPLFRRLLVPLDGSQTSAAILGPAAALARSANGVLVLARIVVPVPLCIYEPGLPVRPSAVIDPDGTREVADTATQDLVLFAQEVERDNGIRVETRIVIADSIAAELLTLALNNNCDLIAMTTHGRGASRLVVGSVTDKVLGGSHLPLLLYHPGSTGPHQIGDIEVPALRTAEPVLR